MAKDTAGAGRSGSGLRASARRVLASRRRGATAGTPAKKSAANKSTKAPAKKSTANKAPAKKAPAKKSTAKKAPAKKAPAKKSTAKKAPAKKAPAKKAPAKKAPAKKTTAKKAPAKKAPAKKTTAKKAPAKKTATKKSAGRGAATVKLAVLPGESPWTRAEVDEVRSELDAERSRLLSEVASAEDDMANLLRDGGEGAGNDQADIGSTALERDAEMSLANNTRDMLFQVDRAKARLADGSYGICESCGNPVGKARLMAFPRATLCMSCKQRQERR